MSAMIAKRSLGGCLTCKRRKKKCDERRPHCKRCEMGNFHCLGYKLSDTSHSGGLYNPAIYLPSPTLTVRLEGDSGLESLDSLVPLLDHKNEFEKSPASRVFFQEVKSSLSNIPRGILFDSAVLQDVTSLIVSQYTRLSRETLFKAPLLFVEQGILRRMDDSNITRWTMYLGARVIVDLFNDNNIQKYLGWILRLGQQIIETSAPNEPESNLRNRLNGLYDMVCLGSLIAGTAIGYSLLRSSTPLFLQLAALYPKIWANDCSISVPETFRSLRYEVTQFIVHDTISAATLGVPPLLQYDTTSPWVDEAPGHYMEWIYGCPVRFLIILAEINAWRTSRVMGGVAQSQNNCRNAAARLNNWNPIVDYTDEPNNNIARLAIQEAWRQATLIYLYMGMYEVNSADPRIERAVQQVVDLGNTFAIASALERHLLIPCLIAGIAARLEKHRAALRVKIVGENYRKVNPLVLPVRASDFIAILDHLWHGAGSGGTPVMWEDYVKSRYVVLPLQS